MKLFIIRVATFFLYILVINISLSTSLSAVTTEGTYYTYPELSGAESCESGELYIFSLFPYEEINRTTFNKCYTLGLLPPITNNITFEEEFIQLHLSVTTLSCNFSFYDLDNVTPNYDMRFEDENHVTCKYTCKNTCPEGEVINDDCECVKPCEINPDNLYVVKAYGGLTAPEECMEDVNTFLNMFDLGGSNLGCSCCPNSVESSICVMLQDPLPNCSDGITSVSGSPMYCSGCDQNNTYFPTQASNEKIVFQWQEPEDFTSECTSTPILGTVQERTQECIKEYRCVKEQDTCSRDETVGSYVSPTAGVFHEDIELIGTDINLHYQSTYLGDDTIAHGWSINSYHTLDGDYLHLGSGKLLNVQAYISQENNATRVTLEDKVYIFDSNNLHTETKDNYTQKTLYTFAYDANNSLISITDNFNNMITINRDANDKVVSITAPHGQINYLEIDESGDLTNITYEDSSNYSFSYTDHLMTSEREPNGNEFIHEFDDNGRVFRVVDAEDGIWSFSNSTDSTHNETVVKRASGDTIVYKDYFLDNSAMLSETTTANGDIFSISSSIDGTNSTSERCGVEKSITYEVDKDLLTLKRVPNRLTTQMPSGLSKTTHYSQNYIFDANNTLIKKETTTQTNDAITSTLRDYNLSVASVTSPEGRVSSISYDLETLLPTTVEVAGLKPIKYEYDEKGRVTRVKQGKRAVEYVYDARGNLAQEINKKEKKIIKYSYDEKDRVIETILADGSTLKYSYDANGNMTRLTTPTPTEHNFAYNGVNRRTSMTSPLGYTTHYTYDKQRRVTQITRASGKTIQNHYEAGELKSITTPEGVTEYSYTCGSKVSTLSNNAESINYSYDGELLTQLQTKGILNQTIEYSYNNNFLIASTNYAGATTTYTYDKDNLLTQSGAFTLTRDEESGMLKSISDGRFKQNYKYNKYGEIKKIKSKNYKLSLKRKNSQISQKTEEINYLNKKQKHKKRRAKQKSKVTYHYAYDKQGRLISVKRNKKEVERYTYDANGNRVEAKVYGVTTQAYYTLDDQIERYGENSYRYDADGYLVEKTTPQGTTTYTYNTLGALTKVSTPTKTINYHLNALNQRVAKEVDGVITQKYLWRDLTTLLAIYDKDDNLIERFEYADNRMPISMTKNSIKYYLHYDQVGTLRLITDENNNIIKEITYDSYGNILKDTNQEFKVPFGFAGGLHDRDTNLVHFGYREYDPQTGKWTTKDPIDFSGGDSNLYGYVLGDPVNFVDPEGLQHTLGPFIPYSGTYTCRDCEAASYAMCATGTYRLGTKALWWAIKNPLYAPNFLQGASTQTPNLTIPAQRHGYAARKLFDALNQ